MNCLVAIVGPTATGKSSLGLQLASKFNGEIINADSRQIYRYMDIGTAKPTLEEQKLVPHHLIDIINPDDEFNLSEYQRQANQIIKDTQKRGKLPFLVGGSGQYVWAVLEGWELPHVAPHPEIRKRLEARATAGEQEQLYQELKEKDPSAAKMIDHHNIRRVIRALEVNEITGAPFSSLRRKKTRLLITLLSVSLWTGRSFT